MTRLLTLAVVALFLGLAATGSRAADTASSSAPQRIAPQTRQQTSEKSIDQLARERTAADRAARGPTDDVADQLNRQVRLNNEPLGEQSYGSSR